MDFIFIWNKMISAFAVDIYETIKMLLTHIIGWKL